MNTDENTKTQKCQYCGKPIEKLVKKKIIYRDRDNRGKAVILTKEMDFCSDKCASYMQFSMEG